MSKVEAWRETIAQRRLARERGYGSAQKWPAPIGSGGFNPER
jgi:hypothetical protein